MDELDTLINGYMSNENSIKYSKNFLYYFATCFVINQLCVTSVYGAATQILSDNFYSNPAELSRVEKTQTIIGNLLLNPVARFNGEVLGVLGTAKSNVNDSLPYLLTGFRINDKVVVGLNITPSGYGHLSWPMDSFVAYDSTVTKVLYYRFGIQSEYQFSEKLSLGIGFNFEWNKLAELNFIVAGSGNQINKVSGLNYTGDLGIYYKINPKLFLSIAGYTQVNTYGYGTSSLGTVVNNNLSLNLTEAPVIYVGLESFIDDLWFLEGKIYWSGWPIQRNIDFTNTTTGSYVVPTDWKDVFSFQGTVRYAAMEKLGLLVSLMYETNPVPLATNAIGYPLAATGTLSGGVDFALRKDLSIQIIYSYGVFLPNSPVDNATSLGTIDAHFQAGILQFVYKT